MHSMGRLAKHLSGYAYARFHFLLAGRSEISYGSKRVYVQNWLPAIMHFMHGHAYGGLGDGTNWQPRREPGTTCKYCTNVHDCPLGRSSSLDSLYSIASTSASQLASMMFSLTPTVPQTSWWSEDSMITRMRAAVPASLLTTRTL